MDLSKLNKPLVRQVRDAILKDTDTFSMGQWGVDIQDNHWWYDDDGEGGGDCGTPACIAGWAIRLALPERDAAGGASMQGDIKLLAGRLLGIPVGNGRGVEEEDLFFPSSWPVWARTPISVDLNADEWELKYALILLNMLLEGKDPWEGQAPNG